MGVGGGGGGWLDQVGVRLTQLSTGLKVEAELGNSSHNMFVKQHDYITDHILTWPIY